MNDFRIKVFLSVAQNLSFTKASAELHISQPAISNHIKEIESMYNVQLFERVKNSIFLTDAGRLFLRHAEQINDKYRELEFEMNFAGESNMGELVVGACQSTADYILPSIMATYMSIFPNLKLSLVRGTSKEIEKLVSERRVDIGLVDEFVDENEFNVSFLGKDELVLVKSYDNREIGQEISIEELIKIPLVLPENGSDALKEILEELKLHFIEYSDLNVIMRLGSTESIKHFISKGNSCAIVPLSAVSSELLRNELSVVNISDLKIYKEFLFISPLHSSVDTEIDNQSDSTNSLAQQFVSFFQHVYNKSK